MPQGSGSGQRNGVQQELGSSMHWGSGGVQAAACWGFRRGSRAVCVGAGDQTAACKGVGGSVDWRAEGGG